MHPKDGIKNMPNIAKIIIITIITGSLLGPFGIATAEADGEIKKLERRLEYLKKKSALAAKLEEAQLEIRLLNENYKDVLKLSGSKSSKAEEKEAAVKLAPRAKGSKHEWTMKQLDPNTGDRQCGDGSMLFTKVKIDDEGYTIVGRQVWSGGTNYCPFIYRVE